MMTICFHFRPFAIWDVSLMVPLTPGAVSCACRLLWRRNSWTAVAESSILIACEPPAAMLYDAWPIVTVLVLRPLFILIVSFSVP